VGGQRRREQNRARRLVKERASTLILPPDARDLVNKHSASLIKHFDQPSLICAAYDLITERITCKAFRAILSDICD
jgi:hypothetical protein